METPTGRRLSPLTSRNVGELGEEQIGALTKFSRTHLFVFPKIDVFLQQPTIEAHGGAARLVLEGYGSTSSFTWLGLSPDVPVQERITADKVRYYTALSYHTLYQSIRRLNQITY